MRKPCRCFLKEAFREYSEEVYLHTDGRDYTYHEIRKMVDALGARLSEMGVTAGDKVAVHIGRGLNRWWQH